MTRLYKVTPTFGDVTGDTHETTDMRGAAVLCALAEALGADTVTVEVFSQDDSQEQLQS